jgi:hypothetical protein
MAWSVYGESLKTADFSGSPVFSQKFTMPQKEVLKAIRTWVVLFNTPVFTNLSLRIYSNVGGSPGQLLWTADTTWTRAQIATEAYALKEIYFEFVNPLFLGQDTYHAVLWASGYTGDDSSHVAWVRTWPDILNNYTPTLEGIATAPFKISLIGAPL